MKTYTLWESRDKFFPYREALTARGWEVTEDFINADAMIIDIHYGDEPIEAIRHAKRMNKPIFMYPHGSRAYMFWDAYYLDYEPEDVLFVPSFGQFQVLTSGSYPARIVAIGFPYCEVMPKRQTELKNVLFAPIHPSEKNGYLDSSHWEEYNQRVWAKLQTMLWEFDLTVYHSQTPEENGLTRIPRVEYVQSDLTIPGALSVINKYDLVIAQETFAHLAIASGVPTVMINDRYEHIKFDVTKRSRYWPYYRDNYVYPFNLLEVDDESRALVTLLNAVQDDGSTIKHWKDHMIGGNFDGKLFVDVIEDYIR